MILARITVAHFAQADHAGHILQFAMAVRRARKAVERMIGNVEFHHAATHIGEFFILRRDLHACGDRRSA